MVRQARLLPEHRPDQRVRRRGVQELPAEEREAQRAGDPEGGPMTATPEERARYKAKVRAWYEDYKSKAKCEACGLPGSVHPDRLQFHHVDNGTKEENVARLVMQARSISTIKREISKCQVLCEDCHAKLHGMAAPAELRRSRQLKGVETDG